MLLVGVHTKLSLLAYCRYYNARMIGALGRFIKSLIVGFIALFKRALCFLQRKRRDSGTILPTHIQETSIDMPTQVLSSNFEFPSMPANGIYENNVVSIRGDVIVLNNSVVGEYKRRWGVVVLNNVVNVGDCCQIVRYSGIIGRSSPSLA